MQEYKSKEALIEAIQASAAKFIQEFDGVAEEDVDLRVEGVDRTPREMIAYQLGWMGLIRGWDREEAAGREAVTPAPGYKWNQMGQIYGGFYERYQTQTLEELRQMFRQEVSGLLVWLDGFTDQELFQPGGRRWAQSTPSNWPIWKWVHINTAAPFQSFRSKIRKWKRVKP